MVLVSIVKREQFQVRSELEVVHIPTGAVFRAYPYSDPGDMLQSVRVNWGRAGTPADSEFSEQIRRMASQLLLEGALSDCQPATGSLATIGSSPVRNGV